MVKNLTKVILAALAVGMTTVASIPTASAALTPEQWQDIVDKMNAEGVSVSYVDDPANPTVINFNKTAGQDAATQVDMTNSTGEARKITGVVTDGTDDSSVATVAYVNGVNQNMTNQINQAATRTLNQAKEYTDQRFDQATDYTNSVGAMAAAMASIPSPPTGGAGQASWGISTGVFHSKVAAAAGLNYDISDNVRASAKVAIQGSENMVGVGLGGTFGKATRGGVSADTERQLRSLTRRLDELEKQNKALMASAGNIKTTTQNYTNMYGHNFRVVPNGSDFDMFNLDGTKMTEQQLRKFAEDFAYNNEGREFDSRNFKKNSSGNYQYQDPEVGWLPGSEQSAVGKETIEHEKPAAAQRASATTTTPRIKENKTELDKILDGE